MNVHKIFFDEIGSPFVQLRAYDDRRDRIRPCGMRGDRDGVSVSGYGVYQESRISDSMNWGIEIARTQEGWLGQSFL
jgi:hypothetical protein